MATGTIKNNIFTKTYTKTVSGNGFVNAPVISGYFPVCAVSKINGAVLCVAYHNVNGTDYFQLRKWNNNYPDASMDGQSVSFIVTYALM